MFEEVIGHARQKDILERQIRYKTISHAYLFSGPEGTGKRKMAEALAVQIIKSGLPNKERKVMLQHADIKEIGLKDENIKIAEIRELINETTVHPLEGDYRVFIIDHADRMKPLAQNALLKTIEEPAEGNVFILITDKPTSILPTIRSRCQEIPFHDVTVDQKKEILRLEQIGEEPKDWSVSPGRIIRSLRHPEHQEVLEEFYERFEQVRNGNAFELFKLAEDLAKSSDLTKECLDLFIRRLYSRMMTGQEASSKDLKTINILFELLAKLSYNINLRLQWESSLIDILLEQ